jgi:hypothetical protein
MFINLLAVVFLLASVEALPEAIPDPKLSGVAVLRVRKIGNLTTSKKVIYLSLIIKALIQNIGILL